MITVQFLRSGDRPLRELGPFPWVRVDARSLRAGPDDKEVAHYHGGTWSTAELSAPKYVLRGTACTLRFEGREPADATVLGPLHEVEIVDGAAYTQPGHHLVARLDEQEQAWYAYDQKRSWSSLLVEHCGEPAAP